MYLLSLSYYLLLLFLFSFFPSSLCLSLHYMILFIDIIHYSLIEPGTDPVTGGGEGRSDRLSTHFDFCSSKKCSNYMYVVIDYIFTFPLSLSLCFVSLCPSFVLTSLSLCACLSVFPLPLPPSLPLFLSSLQYTSFLSPVKITSNRTTQ